MDLTGDLVRATGIASQSEDRGFPDRINLGRLAKLAARTGREFARELPVSEAVDVESGRRPVYRADPSCVSGNPAVATVSLGIPDFLVTGPLRGTILDDLGSWRQATLLADQLGKEPVQVTAFIASARARAAIFQTGTDEGSRQLLMALRGMMKGYSENMVIRADYNGDFEFIDAHEYPDDTSSIMVDYDRSAHWYLPLIAKVRFWSNELLTW